MTPEYLAKPLTPFPLPTTDGWMLRTIADTGAYILALPKKRKRLAHWEQVSRLIVKKAGVATVTQQVHHALSKDGKLDALRLRASPALGVGGAHRSWRRNDPNAPAVRCERIAKCARRSERRSRTASAKNIAPAGSAESAWGILRRGARRGLAPLGSSQRL